MKDAGDHLATDVKDTVSGFWRPMYRLADQDE
jgi:hypothetical protein